MGPNFGNATVKKTSNRVKSLFRKGVSIADTPAMITDEEFELIQNTIYQEAGIFLNDSKRVLVCSRLAKRLRALGLASYLDYLDYVLVRDSNGIELQEMVNCLTTNKTEFYREPHHFEYLNHEVLPGLEQAKLRSGSRKVRIWSCACSMGHEPYTLAITLREFFDKRRGWDLRILASDIDTNVLGIATDGIYPKDDIGIVPLGLQQKYFLRGTGKWEGTVKVKPALQDLVTFRQINVNKANWPVQTRFDAIFCRNLLIYFDQDTQQRLLRRLAEYLEPEGFLFIGHSENMSWGNDLYKSLGGTVYQLKGR